MTSMPLTSTSVRAGVAAAVDAGVAWGLALIPSPDFFVLIAASAYWISTCSVFYYQTGQGRPVAAIVLVTAAYLDVFLLGVFLAVLFHQRVDHALVGLVPVGDHFKLAAVPLGNACPVGAHVVVAAGLDGAQHLAKAQFVQALLRQVQVLQAPAHLLGRHGLAFTKFFLGSAHGFYLQHGNHHATGVGQGADAAAIFGGAFALVVHHGLEVVVHLVVLGGVVDGDGVVALGTGTDVAHIVFRARPPDAVHLVARIARGLCFTHGGGCHHAGRPQQHVVGALLAHLQPGRFLLYARRGDGQLEQLKAFFGRALFQQRDGLLATGRVVLHQRDFLALEAAFFLLQDVLNHRVGGRPVGAQQREIPLKHATIGRLRQTIAGGHDGGLVVGCLVADGKGDTRGLGVKAARSACTALQALVAFHALAGVVGGFALFKRQLDAIHPTARVHQLEVVHLAIGPWDAQGCELARAVHQQRHELVFCVGGGGGEHGAQARCDGGGSHGDGFELHRRSPG